uniref:Uncharacterized protein n=1 Tax=Arundo donax TaxID=35708 RepID=A0A0A9B1B9_ARUDO
MRDLYCSESTQLREPEQIDGQGRYLNLMLLKSQWTAIPWLQLVATMEATITLTSRTASKAVNEPSMSSSSLTEARAESEF